MSQQGPLLLEEKKGSKQSWAKSIITLDGGEQDNKRCRLYLRETICVTFLLGHPTCSLQRRDCTVLLVVELNEYYWLWIQCSKSSPSKAEFLAKQSIDILAILNSLYLVKRWIYMTVDHIPGCFIWTQIMGHYREKCINNLFGFFSAIHSFSTVDFYYYHWNTI